MRRAVIFAVMVGGMAPVVVAQAPKPEPVVPITLPVEARFPEGVAFDAARQVFYTANAETGAVVEVARKDGAARVVVPPGILAPAGTQTFPVALGMKVDMANRLWIAGGRTGRMFVVDLKSGRVVKQVVTPDPSNSLINDVAIVAGAGYFTDTRTPTMWRLASKGAQILDLEPWLSFADTPIQYDSGANLNGIAVTADGASLVVVQMGKGLLFSIDVASKAVRQINTTGIDLTGGDGLVIAGNRLYVVRQPAGEIVTLELAPDLTSAKLLARLRDPLLAWPATAVLVDNALVVANSQFNTRVTKTQREPFTLLTVPLSRLAPAAAVDK
jgi:Cu-Zn family superoxide dismutase